MPRFLKQILFLSFFTVNIFAQINVSLPDTTLNGEKSVVLPVKVTELSGYYVRSFSFKIKYDNNIIDYKSFDYKNTLSDRRGWRIYDDDEKGILTISANGYFSLSGSGVLLQLEFDIISEKGETELQFESFVFNQGYPKANTKNGFIRLYTEKVISFSKIGNGEGEISIDGISYELPFERNLIYGKSYVLKALPLNSSEFNNWSGAVQSSSNPILFQIGTNTEIIAEFSLKTFTVSAQVIPQDFGIVNGQGVYNYGDLATVQANAYTGMQFVNWTVDGNEVSNNLAYEFNVFDDTEVIANFIQSLFQISAVVIPEEAGQVEGAGYFYSGQEVSLNAKSNYGWKFSCWTEFNDTISYDSTLTFNVANDRKLTANFLESPNPTLIKEKNNILSESFLKNPFPNPFNPSTNFVFQIANSSIVNLEVFDISGRIIQKIIANKIFDKGQFEFTFNALDLPSGVYFFKFNASEILNSKTFTKSGKIILVK